MSLQENTSQLEEILFKNNNHGYSLRINSFNQWMKSHNKSYEMVAKELGISERTLREKILGKKQFNKKLILKLLSMMDELEAFHIIYFETFAKRDRVYKSLFKHKKEQVQEEEDERL